LDADHPDSGVLIPRRSTPTVQAGRPDHRRCARGRPDRHVLAPQSQRARDRTHQDRLLDHPRRQGCEIPSGTRFRTARTLRLRLLRGRRAAACLRNARYPDWLIYQQPALARMSRQKECLVPVSFPPPRRPVGTFFFLVAAPAGTPQGAGFSDHLSEPRAGAGRPISGRFSSFPAHFLRSNRTTAILVRMLKFDNSMSWRTPEGDRV
jgi:hypothetical protein